MNAKIFSLFFILLNFSIPSFCDILAKEGQGYLEQQNGQNILHLKGTPYERGYQHGTLLKEQIQRNISTYIDTAKSHNEGRVNEFTKNIPVLMSYVPEHIKEEMQGVADASQIPIQKIIALNLFPEMFHCSGITVSGDATKNGEQSPRPRFRLCHW